MITADTTCIAFKATGVLWFREERAPEQCGAGDKTDDEGEEIYTVTSLADTGAGTLRNGVVERNFNGDHLIPRKIVFAVSGVVPARR